MCLLRSIYSTVWRSVLGAVLGLSFGAAYVSADTFNEALVAAYQNHPQLMAERARVRETDETYVQAQSQGRFTANSTASVGLTSSTSSFELDLPTQSFVSKSHDTFVPLSFAITGQLPLYQGGRVRSLKGQAKYGILAARENLRNAEQSVLLDAATAYTDVLRDEEIARARRGTVRVLSRQGDAARERFNVGAGTRTDIAQADARVAGAEAGLASAEAALAVSRASYQRVVGYVPSQLQPVTALELPGSLEAIVQMALAYNPQLEAARYAEDAANFGIDVAKSNRLPTISLQTFAQMQRDVSPSSPTSDAIGVAANLTIPLASGGLNSSRIRSAEAAKTRARFETRNAEDGVRQTVTSLWAQLGGAKAGLLATQSQISAAEIALEGVQIEQEVGTRTSLDVLDAEQEVLDARLTQIEAASRVDVLTFQILAIAGAFDAVSLQLPVDFYDPKQNFDQVSQNSFKHQFREIIEEFPSIDDITGQ